MARPCEQGPIWHAGDFVFSPEYDIMSHTPTARLYGFHEALAIEGMFVDLFEHNRQEGIIPRGAKA